MKAHDPQGTIELNVRAILSVMRNAGLHVKPIDKSKHSHHHEGRAWFRNWQNTKEDANEPEHEQEDPILGGNEKTPGTNGRWIELDIPQP